MLITKPKIIKNTEIAKDVFKMVLNGDFEQIEFKPGQFINIRIGDSNEFLLRRPISICEVKTPNEITIIYKINGKGTKKLSCLKDGEYLDILVPLGNGYNLDVLKAGDIALLIGGGIGVPPLYELAKQFNAKGIKTVHILGFNTRDEVFYEEEFSQLGLTYVATADGSYGYKGFVTDILNKENISFTKYFSCGPIPMLKALSSLLQEREGYFSLENRMACGIGACYACVCKIKGAESHQYTRVCYDGPVYKAGYVELE